MSVIHLMKRAAEAGDQRAIEGLKILQEMAAEAAISAVEGRIEAALAPVVEAQTLMAANLAAIGRLLFVPEATEPPAEEGGWLPNPPEEIILDEEAEEDLDAARAAEEALPATAVPVGPGGEPPVEPEDEQ